MIKEPTFENLPSKEDFYYDGGCDERYAINNYHGKNIDFMLKKCKSSFPLGIFGDFYLVGTKAFRYYIFAVFRYIQEALDTRDIDMLLEITDTVSMTVNLITKHLDENQKDMEYIAPYIKEFSKWAIENYEFFDINEEIYGNVKEKWQELIKKVEELYEV